MPDIQTMGILFQHSNASTSSIILCHITVIKMSDVFRISGRAVSFFFRPGTVFPVGVWHIFSLAVDITYFIALWKLKNGRE